MTRESDLLESACAMVESTPGILGGTPVIRGTRVPVHDVGAWAKAGVPMQEILDHYPSLTDEQVRLSHIYADVYPAPSRTHRERPQDAELVAERTLPRIDG